MHICQQLQIPRPLHVFNIFKREKIVFFLISCLYVFVDMNILEKKRKIVQR